MTEKAFVLGHPVAHSKSPVMHNAAYKALGWDWDYGFADCATEDEARAFLAGGDWRALNITMPYKPHALQAADDPTAAAQVAGGANVLIRRADGSLFADNTDGKGCVAYLRRRGVEFANARVVVCGTGPTSISIMHACACADAAEVSLLSRDGLRAACALERYASTCEATVDGLPAARFAALSYEGAAQVIASADVIVDATSLGMNEGDPAPFDTALLHAGQTVFDVVYGHGETALLHAARAAGCAAYDGAGMLVAQAVETVIDIAAALDGATIPSGLDLFAVMAETAGFALA